MKYMGSKNRLAKYILPIILKDRTGTYFEPFVGGGNLIDKVDGKRIGCDVNSDVINALVVIRDKAKQIPKNNNEFSEDEYKNRCENIHWLKGFASFAYSYGGKHWGGWCRDKDNVRDYVAEAYRNAIKQSENLVGVELRCCDYHDIVLPYNTTIYCDPPYRNTTKYKNSFDYDLFYNWCCSQKSAGHTVFVSEYNMPNNFTCVWEREQVSSLTKNTGGKKAIEKLFTLN